MKALKIIELGSMPPEDFEGSHTLMFLNSRKAEEWKAGRWKFTYTGFPWGTKYLRCLSGDYEYIIEREGSTERIPRVDVPENYRACLPKREFAFKTPAKLIRIIPRELRKS